jgi:DNA-binding CsgD family transcriptional regulator
MQDQELFVLRVRDDGRIAGANEAARQFLGGDNANACYRAVAAKDASGKALCSEHCARKVLLGEMMGVLTRRANVRGRPGELLCQRVGDEVIVLLRFDESNSIAPSERLTTREREVLRLVAKGLTSAAIARELGIHASTVRTHVEHARERLGAKSRAEAVGKALATRQL